MVVDGVDLESELRPRPRVGYSAWNASQDKGVDVSHVGAQEVSPSAPFHTSIDRIPGGMRRERVGERIHAQSLIGSLLLPCLHRVHRSCRTPKRVHPPSKLFKGCVFYLVKSEYYSTMDVSFQSFSISASRSSLLVIARDPDDANSLCAELPGRFRLVRA
jgi:hypothetical protein